MGAVKHIAVTGAGGFLGRAIVAQGLAQGLTVTALVRRTPKDDLGCETLVIDLAKASKEDTLSAIGSADAIIHAAGEMSGDIAVHARSTLPATRTVCQAAEASGAHLVLISSIAVYDYMSVPEGAFVTETTPIDLHPEARDGYVAAKLDQEKLVADFFPAASVLRVGALFGPNRTWNAHMGVGLGPILLRLAARGQVPLCHVARCADVAIASATAKTSGAVNVLDADLPDRVRFLSALGKSGWPKMVVPVPWQIFNALGKALGFWKGRPGLLQSPVLHARMKPVGFDTSLLTRTFPDLPKQKFETLMREALKHG